MAALITVFYSRAMFLVIWLIVSAVGQSRLSCETTSANASGYRCNGDEAQNHCKTFAILRTNSYYSSLSNISFYLGLNRFAIAEANRFSAQTEFLPLDEPLLIPIDCKCSGGVFQAEVAKMTVKGESFYGIAESLEGLTTCKAIRDKNSGVSPWNIGDKVRLRVPLKCACPSSADISAAKGVVLLSYPVRAGDTTSNLAIKFNTTPEAVVLANKRSLGTFRPEILTPLTTILIPVSSEHILWHVEKPREPNLRFPPTGIPTIAPHVKKPKKRKTVIYIAIAGAAAGAIVTIAAIVLMIHLNNKKKKQNLQKGHSELQQLSLSVRTTSDKKISFEGSQDTPEGRVIDTPRKMMMETYTMEELKRATEDFGSSNHIEGTVYHGRLEGKDVAIKRIEEETISKLDVGLFHNAIRRHPNIITMFGMCVGEGNDAFLVFEFAKNGSLKDWLHGGLAMKNQFIASCDRFLTWNQRLRICLDVAMALQYMHQALKPSYVHRNIKSRNIFLDEEFHAKIGNFGMARCVEANVKDSEVYSTHPASWSLGYLAPEYVHQGVVSTRMDIFAFGVILLEVLTGKTPTNKKGESGIWLYEEIKSKKQSENADELREWMDGALGENYSLGAAVALANLAGFCVEEDPSLRPTAGEVVEKLSKLVRETAADGERILGFESTSKPLVIAAAPSL